MTPQKPVRSALEIALERSQHFDVDDATLQAIAVRKKAEVLVGMFLNQESYSLETALRDSAARERSALEKGCAEVLLGNVQLPGSTQALAFLQRCLNGVAEIKGKKSGRALTELKSLLEHYLQQKDVLQERLEEEFAPALRRVEEQLAAQNGTRTKLSVDQHPEFLRRRREILSQFDGQYDAELQRLKAEVSS